MFAQEDASSRKYLCSGVINQIISAIKSNAQNGFAFTTILHADEIDSLCRYLYDSKNAFKYSAAAVLLFSLDGTAQDGDVCGAVEECKKVAAREKVEATYVAPFIRPEEKIAFKDTFGSSPFCGAIFLECAHG